MNSSISQKHYEEISFNNECHRDQQQIVNINDHSTHNDQPKIQRLLQKIHQLETELQKQKQKSSQLQKRNQQLTDMLVSASQSNVKRNQQFIKQVQRKIYNFQAKKSLTQSHFDSLNTYQKQPEQLYHMKMKTESTYESQKMLQKLKSKEARYSEQRTQNNKENLNFLNHKTSLQTRNKSKNNENKRNEDFYLDNLTERSFNKTKISRAKHVDSDRSMNKVSSKTDLMKDLKIMRKIESKLAMRN